LFVAGLNHQRSLIAGDFRFFICTESAEELEEPIKAQRDTGGSM
jgi:hypothetical protein